MELMTWFYFAAACLGLAATPGPNALLVMSHSVRFGPGRTLYTIAGGCLAFTGLMAVSVFGIGALLKIWPSLLSYIRYAGGLYLIYMGIRQWRSPSVRSEEATLQGPSAGRRTLFLQGIFSAGSNPKVFLFFGAFLSQFLNPDKSIVLQFVLMAATFVLAEFIGEMTVCLIASRMRHFIQRSGRQFSYVCGSLFAVIGVIVILRP